MSTLQQEMADTIREFILEEARAEERVEPKSDPFWAALRQTGTELWLDTGDIDDARDTWTAEMSALTTNNSLLNKEIQKGLYDDLIARAAGVLGAMETRQRVQEVAFILNAHHGLRLAATFGGWVSVELHTDLADDLEGIVHYGTRFNEISPDHFIVKVPLTATGLLGARRLRELGIPVNFTLEFSARQNALVSVIARPNYCNVFLGRLGAYIKDHGLGDGVHVGERATVASQRVIRELTGHREVPTRQIAASMRNGAQVHALAGVDVFTMPTKVAAAARGEGDSEFADQVDTDFPISLAPGVDAGQIGIDKLWDVDAAVRKFARECDENPPATGDELAGRARTAGLGDIFPELSQADRERIASDGKIPDHGYWKARIAAGELAIDTLLNLGGLAAFAADQAELDDRIRGLISG